MAGLYIHIPFCKSKCPYCDFYSIVRDKNTISEYSEAVIEEARIVSSRITNPPEIKTIFIGGGTPSIDIELLMRISEGVREYFDLLNIEEFTIEVNPEDVLLLNLNKLKAIGVNRISVGMQSFSDRHLRILGRRTNNYTNIRAYERLREKGFDNISIDLIYGIKDGGRKEWEEILEKAIELKPDHISIYELNIANENPIFNNKIDDDKVVDMYYLAIEKLTTAGYNQYEISNLSNMGRECEHNMNYWRYGEYIGLGPSASSFINGVRYTNYRDLSLYKNLLRKGELPIEIAEELSYEKKAREALILALRLKEGVSISVFKERFGFHPKTLVSDIPKEIKNALIKENYDRITLTQEGLLLSDEVFSYII
ncbi:MAG: radical SAM family heme chaperone HemW [bacterium]